MSLPILLIAPQKMLVLDCLGRRAATERRGAGLGDGWHLEPLELKSCFPLDLTECGHSAVPSVRGWRTQPFGVLLWPPPGQHGGCPPRGTWAARLGGRFRLWGEKSRRPTHTGHRPRRGDMPATGDDTMWGWRWASVASPWDRSPSCSLVAGHRNAKSRPSPSQAGPRCPREPRDRVQATASPAPAPAPAHTCGPGGPSGPGERGRGPSLAPAQGGRGRRLCRVPSHGGLGNRGRGRPPGWGWEPCARLPPGGGSGLSGEFMPLSGPKVSGPDTRRRGCRGGGRWTSGGGACCESLASPPACRPRDVAGSQRPPENRGPGPGPLDEDGDEVRHGDAPPASHPLHNRCPPRVWVAPGTGFYPGS